MFSIDLPIPTWYCLANEFINYFKTSGSFSTTFDKPAIF